MVFFFFGRTKLNLIKSKLSQDNISQRDTARIKLNNILVVEDQIRTPNVSGGDSDLSDATIILRVPLQVHVFPFLERKV